MFGFLYVRREGFFASGIRRSEPQLPLRLVVGRPAGPTEAAATVATSSSVILITVAAVAATVTIVVAVSVFVPVLLVVVTSLLVGGGGAGRRPVADLSVVPAGLSSVVLSFLLGRIHAAAGLL